MKKAAITHIALVAIAALFLASCTDLLEIRPRRVIVAEDALKTPEQVQQMLNSAYDLYRRDQFLGGHAWIAAELLADNLNIGEESGNMLAIYNRNTSIFNDVSRQLWNTGYTTIYRCNLVLEALLTVQGFTPEQKANVRGQALFLRAAAHFELLRFFAQPYGYTMANDHPGIPLRISTSRETLPRASVAAVYEQVLSDLNTAVQELPGNLRAGYANVWAAKGMLARVYFQMNNFVLAYRFSRDVVINSPNIFTNDLSARFARGGNTENVFELVSTGNTNPGQQSGAALGVYFSSVKGLPRLAYSANFYNDLRADTADKRFKLWVTVQNTGSGTIYMPSKIREAAWFNVPVIHLGEMKLIRAESAAEQGFLTESLIELNDIRRRAGLKNFIAFFNGDIINECRRQRRLELVLEGNRIHDLKRQAARGNAGLRVRNAPWNCPGMVFAIPDDEISANPLMIQNPAGGCD